jgi:tight adherence protein C
VALALSLAAVVLAAASLSPPSAHLLVEHGPLRGALAAVLAGLVVAAVGGGAPSAALVAVAAAALVLLRRRRRATADAGRSRRALEVRLPDALDLLAGVVEAGSTLDAALAGLADHVQGPLGVELRRCAQALASGGSRRAAFASLAGSGSPDLARLGAALSTADALGTPLASLLREQASLQRELRRLRVRERAAAAAPKMALVVAFLLVPAGLVLVLGAQVLGLLAAAHG